MYQAGEYPITNIFLTAMNFDLTLKNKKTERIFTYMLFIKMFSQLFNNKRIGKN